MIAFPKPPPHPDSALIRVLGDQLSPGLSSLRAGDRDGDIVLMVEVMEEATYVPHHKKKIAFVFSAMRHFRDELSEAGWSVDYVQLDDFVEHALPEFGDYQDAMLEGRRFLYHSVLSPYINVGLLDPLQVCSRVARAYDSGHAPLDAVEGFAACINQAKEEAYAHHTQRLMVIGNFVRHAHRLPSKAGA